MVSILSNLSCNLEETRMLLQHASVIAELGVDSIKSVVDGVKTIVDSFEPRVQLVKKPATNDINMCLGVHGGGGALMDDCNG